MKSIILIFSMVAFSIIGKAQSNIYHPLPSSNAIWREECGGYQSGNCADYQNFITGDTAFNELIYKKIQRTGVQYAQDPFGFCTNFVTSYFNYYMGAYRNDSVNKKVYFVPANALNPTILYDFNLNLFDSLPVTYLFDTISGFSYVSSIDSLLIGNEYHKRFRISSDNGSIDYVSLIEGIGSSSGLLGSLVYPFEFGSTLHCFIQNGITVYPNASYQCDLVTEIDDKTKKDLSFQISPNPISDNGQVLFNSNIINIDLLIFNILGIERFRFNNLKNESKINLSSLQPGIYVYHIVQNQKSISVGRIIKTK
ncbi:MAG: T9SS type A sorting domain-containing protein [Bacteroidales bacterium]